MSRRSDSNIFGVLAVCAFALVFIGIVLLCIFGEHRKCLRSHTEQGMYYQYAYDSSGNITAMFPIYYDYQACDVYEQKVAK